MAKKEKKGEASDEVTEAEEPQVVDQRTRDRIADALTAKRVGSLLPCTICGKVEWRVGYFVPVPVSFAATEMSTLPKKIYPSVAVICDNCGNTHLVNIRILGFTEEDMEQMKFEPPAEASDA